MIMNLSQLLPRKRAHIVALFLGMSCLIVINLFIILSPKRPYVVDKSLRLYTLEELSKYDGTDPAKPIYLGFEGRVYDVTSGSAYYIPSGSYHSLAKRDATDQLHIAGGAIIKAKYPVIGRLE
jgi:predicted heme/steroid binding protein